MKTDASRAATAAGCHGATAELGSATYETTPLCQPTDASYVSVAPTRSALLRRAPWHARLTFQWADYLVAISRARTIRTDDVWQLDPQDRSAATYDALMARLTRPRDFVSTTLQLHWRDIALSGALSLIAATADMASPLLLYIAMKAVADATTSASSIVGTLVLYYGTKVVRTVCALHSTCIRATVATRTLGALETLTFDTTISSMRSSDVTVSGASTMFFELTDIYEFLLVMHGLWTCPLSLATSLALLYYILGDAMVGAVLAAGALSVITLIFKRVSKRIARHLLEHQEKRLQIMGECFKTIQSIKFHASEHRFLSRIYAERKTERAASQKKQMVEAVWRAMLTGMPELLLASSFAVFVVTHEGLVVTPAMIFASLVILYRMKDQLNEMQSVLSLFAAAGVALKHMIEFLETSNRPISRNTFRAMTSPSANPDEWAGTHRVDQPAAIRIQNAAIGRTTEPVIVMANLSVGIGSLTVIHGATGVGKSSLLEAMVDGSLVINAPKGSIHAMGRVAYCSQHTWLRSISIRENITFGLPFDEEKYLNVLHACCLLRDLEALHQGDATLIGPKGMALSGGQKSRIALARACYADADVYLLDSPLSSVDAIVQGDIFRRCFVDLLRWKTIVLISHNDEIIQSPYVDQVVQIKDHRLIVERLSTQRKSLPGSSRVRLTASPARLSAAASLSRRPGHVSSEHTSALATSRQLNTIDIRSTRIEHKWRRIELRMQQNDTKPPKKGLHKSSTNDPESPIQTARRYINLCGGKRHFLLPLALFLVFARSALIIGHLWICAWSANMLTLQTTPDDVRDVSVFLTLLIVSSVTFFIASSVSIYRSAVAADTLFGRMVRGVLFASMSFFYDQPIGEMMNRFAEDVHEVDERAANMLFESVNTLVGVVLLWLVVAYIFPEMLLVAPAVLWLLYDYRHQMKLALEILQLITASYGPCFNAISEAVDGRHIIQAFGPHQVARFRQEHHLDIDKLLRLTHAQTVVRSWGALQFLKVDTLFLLVITVAILLRRDSLVPAFGLALYYIVTVNRNLFGFYQATLKFLVGTVKIRHVEEYGDIRPEQADDSPKVRKTIFPTLWPAVGGIVFENVSFGYDSAAGTVLKNIELTIQPGENVGLVGRTGAGKSSLTLALFRIHELRSGRILIDGIDISLIDIHTLRSRLAIVPQNPMLFKGTLRGYLDPLDEYEDVALWELLRKTGLANVVSRLDGKLFTELQQNADNLSLGERQLLCLSRVLLEQTRVVVLDEATVALDHHADEALQRVIKEELKHATVISIAHRLESILSFDRVVVMDEGRIVQSGTVDELVVDANGPFFDLLEGALLKV